MDEKSYTFEYSDFKLPTTSWWVVSFLLVGAMAGVGVFFQHHTPGESPWLPPCLFNHLTGLFCTGCGITRALWALSQGMIIQALAMNALAVLAIPVGALVWLNEGLGRRGRMEGISFWLRDARVWALVILIFTLSRNIPVFPMTWLAPA